MSSQLKHRYTLEEYFALERESQAKYEFWNGEVFCMSGASLAHNQIAINIGTEARLQLRERGCRVFPSDLRVKVPTFPPYRYPDLTALCGEPEIEKVGGLEMLVNPSLIVEILSRSTEGLDRGDKFSRYKSIPSFSEYLLIAQHRPHVSQFVKRENNIWTFEEFNDVRERVQCVSVPCEMALSEIYRDVIFNTAERPQEDEFELDYISDETSQ
jgi:Uma2 family endonuclease